MLMSTFFPLSSAHFPRLHSTAMVFHMLLSVLSTMRAATGEMVEIQTPNGRLRGEKFLWEGHNVSAFLGVPFAEPPTGRLRFMPPRPKSAWNGTKDALQPSPACMQPRDDFNTSFWGSEMWNHNTPIHEDCLYVNMWVPTSSEPRSNLTIMVWLFGGGFYYGSPSLQLYDGKELAARGDVIVININYRVGAFGFLYLGHPEVPGNMGMLDQQLAIRWIKQNARSFGGDPDKITLFGESAGASSIVAHLIAPGSRNLFTNGILQSGSLDNRWSMDTPQHAFNKSIALARLVGCNHSDYEADLDKMAQCLRNAPAEKLKTEIWSIPNLNYLEFPLVIVSRDENFFQQYDAFDALRNGDLNRNVNIMIGINHDEGNFWNIYNLKEYFYHPMQPHLTRHEFDDCVERIFHFQPKAVRNAAKHTYGNHTCPHELNKPVMHFAEQVNQMVGDYFFTCDSLWLADQWARPDYPGRVFVYYFDQPSSANPWPKWTGVMHGYEIEFIFGAPIFNHTAGYTKQEKIFSEKMLHYWSTFAKTGRPQQLKPKKHPDETWQPYQADSQQWLYLKVNQIKMDKRGKLEECEVWRNAKDFEYRGFVKSISGLLASVKLLVISIAISWFLPLRR